MLIAWEFGDLVEMRRFSAVAQLAEHEEGGGWEGGGGAERAAGGVDGAGEEVGSEWKFGCHCWLFWIRLNGEGML